MEIIVLYKGFNAMSEGIQVASTPFRVSSICPSAFSTFSGVISWYVTGVESRCFCLVTDSAYRHISSSCSAIMDMRVIWTCPRRTYNGWRSPPSSFRRYRPHPDLQNLTPRRTLQWWQILSSAHPSAGCHGNGWWYYDQESNCR